MPSKDASFCHRPRAFTLIELSLILAVLMLMISILILGINAYRRGSDRATCIQQIASVQKAVRSYSNLYGLNSGETHPSLQGQIIGANRFFEVEPVCPAGGIYIFGGDVVPLTNVLYLECGILEHEPPTTTAW